MREPPTLEGNRHLWQIQNACVTMPGECSASRSTSDDESLTIRADFVAMGGSEGETLEANQLTVIQEILLWRHRHTAPQVPAE
ncbi:hypothetical protein Airi02_039100 [Actinoallomurus iriomotensis]|uniref:Uncharacterized protein n=1 Tax=Actinoallomurus iriomotensis TaxID=478107 RepID=A0A9W6S2C5_9ACTN|nr:hypothetical protein Airi02_039100 [Actinoallomurus iriomotensis]